MKANKNQMISFRCTTKEYNYYMDKAKNLNVTIGNYFINCAKIYESNTTWKPVNVIEVAECGNFIKSLEYKYQIESEDSKELNRRIIKLCQN